jgi:hypothetical protein
MALDTATVPVARDTALLSAAHASDSAMVQLSVAVASIMLVDVIQAERLIGLGPAIVIATGSVGCRSGTSPQRSGARRGEETLQRGLTVRQPARNTSSACDAHTKGAIS